MSFIVFTRMFHLKPSCVKKEPYKIIPAISLPKALLTEFFGFILFGLNLFSEVSNLSNLAYTNYLSGNLKKSIEYYKTLFETENNYDALLNIAMIYKDMDDYKNSLYYLERALDIKKTDDVLTEAGWLYFHTSNIDKARVYFEDAFKLNSKNYNAVLGIATVYSHLGDIIKTVDYLNIYKKLRGDYSGVDYIFAWNYFNFKMYDRAKEYLIATLRKDPSFVEARVPLAQIYLKEGDYNQAWNQYYRILDDVPDHPVAMRMIKVIEGKLTKQPEELRPPFKINNPTVIDETYDINNLKKSIKLRVAIGASDSGKQRVNTNLKFRSFSGIGVYGKSGKKYSEVGKNEVLRLKYEHGQISLYSGNNIIKNIFKKAFVLKPLDTKNGSIIVESDYKSLNPYFKYSDREYRGDIEIVPLDNGFGIINIVDLETYLLGVVPAEMEPKWPIEALKAQAVIARTEAVRRYKEGPHKKQGYDLCDTEHCQVYRGVSYEKNSSNKAVFETEGRVLTYNNRLAYSFYHSNCGGYIQASSEVTGWGSVPYLVSHPDHYEKKGGLEPWEFELWIKQTPDAYCNYSGVVRDSEFRWMRIIKRSEINFKLNKRYNIGELKSIAVMKRSRSGNVNSVKITGSKRTVTVDREHIIRNIFGLNSLKSTLFNLEINRFPDGRIRNVWFYGGGWGHSIGMCQGGAAGMAGKYGKNYKEILNFYFPGTKIKKLKFIKKTK